MAHRLVTDALGCTWQVWAVRPLARAAARGAALAPEYRDGWLAFERLDGPSDVAGRDPRVGARPPAPDAGHEPEPAKRRHTPIPPAWEDAPDAAVLAWLALAAPVVPRPSRPEVPLPPLPASPSVPPPRRPPPALS
jgi:hypothetical protein